MRILLKNLTGEYPLNRKKEVSSEEKPKGTRKSLKEEIRRSEFLEEGQEVKRRSEGV